MGLPSEEYVWSKNEPKVWPRLAYEDMVDYLILSKTYDGKQMKAFRSLYSHNYVENGWLGDIFHCLEGCAQKCLWITALYALATFVLYEVIITEDKSLIKLPVLFYRQHIDRKHFVEVGQHDAVVTPSDYIITTVINHTLFITSAFTRCDNRILIVTVADSTYKRASDYACCLLQDNGTLAFTNKFEKLPFLANRRLLLSAQLIFDLPDELDNFRATIVKMSSNANETVTDQCPTDVKAYVRPNVPLIPRTYRNLTETHNKTIDQNCMPQSERSVDIGSSEPFSIAICAKLAFKNLDPHLVIEWMEYNKKMGVSLVVAYTYNLNSTTRRVLKYYEDNGNMVVYTFDYPLKERHHRQPGGQNHMSWNDEQHALNDCYERVRLYKYVFVVDFDEFLVPVKDNNFSGLLDRLRRTFPLASAFVFYPEFHNTDKNESSVSNDGASTHINSTRLQSLYAERFFEHTDAIRCAIKGMLIPGRCHFWSPHTHGPRDVLKPYTSVEVKPEIARLAHYRRSYRPKLDKKACMARRQVQLLNLRKDDKIMRFFDDELRSNIIKKKKLLLY